MQEITKTRSGSLIFNLEVEVPAAEAEAFAETITGDDNDVALAAERAIRERLGEEDIDSEVELYLPDADKVKDRLRELGQEAHRL